MNEVLTKLASLAVNPQSNRVVLIQKSPSGFIGVKVEASGNLGAMAWSGRPEEWEEALREARAWGVTSEEGTITQEVFEQSEVF
jgi:hypothetical protein